MRKKPTRKQSYFTMKPAMTAILCDASGKMHHGILFDRRLSYTLASFPVLCVIFGFVKISLNFVEKYSVAVTFFFAPGWTAHQHVQHYLQNQPLAPLLISKSWQGKLLNPRAIRKTLLHFFCQPRLDLETILALLWNIPHLYERFTNHTPHSFVTLSSTTKLGLGLPNKVMSTCELSKLELDETKKGQWARVFLVGFSSSLVRVLWVRLKPNKPGNRVIVSSMGCFIVQLRMYPQFLIITFSNCG